MYKKMSSAPKEFESNWKTESKIMTEQLKVNSLRKIILVMVSTVFRDKN